MYQGIYDINEYHFDTNTKEDLGFTIYAREEKTALAIIKILNDRYKDLPPYVPSKRHYCKHIKTNTPPYELEQEQAKCISTFKRRW